MEIHRSARRHGVPDDDISHAYVHALAWLQLDDDPRRYLLAGPDKAGNLLELVVLELHARLPQPSETGVAISKSQRS